MPTNLYPTQYSQGSQVVITVNTLDQNGNPLPPDNNVTPNYSIQIVTPQGNETVVNNALTTMVKPTFYIATIDSTRLAVGSYLATLNWQVSGMSMSAQVRFDIVQTDGFALLPMDPISQLRIRIRDNNNDPTLWVFGDQELSLFLQNSLDDMNAAPPRSSFYWYNVPIQCIPNILLGAEIAALESLAIKTAHEPVTYTDKGVTVNKPQQVATYQNIARMLRDKYEPERLRIKRNMQPAYGYIVQPSMPYMANVPLRAIQRNWW